MPFRGQVAMTAVTPDTPRLLLCDFDGTQFYTSEPAPGGIDVNKGYEIGIATHLGEAAAAQFVQDDGHNHRSPAEIINSLAPHLGAEAVKVTAAVVQTKLEVLESCIGRPLEDGTPWPRPSAGFSELWNRIDTAKLVGEPIGTAVISNGHTSFEQKTFEMLNLSQPDMYLTDDVLQALAFSLPHHLQVKPSPMLADLARHLWSYRLSSNGREPSEIYTVVIGDDPQNDGGLARNANADFVLLDPENARDSWQEVALKMSLGTLASAPLLANGR